jgi:diadenosine tetraphosphate (Ap4A) HIT family hydrolase
MTGWQVFPFEPDGLRVVRLAPPQLPEPDRHGEGGSACGTCVSPEPAIWSDERWRLTVLAESGAPLLLMLQPVAHHDLSDLPDDLAAELGRLIVHISRAIEALPNVARAHVSRWGDGGAHLHLFFYARPAGFPQLRGTCMAIWDDLLPAVPAESRSADAAAVALALAASYGGAAAG